MNDTTSKMGLRLVQHNKSTDKPASAESNLIIIDDSWALPKERIEPNTNKTIKLRIVNMDDL